MGVDRPEALASKYPEALVFRTQQPAYSRRILQLLDERLRRMLREEDDRPWSIPTT